MKINKFTGTRDFQTEAEQGLFFGGGGSSGGDSAIGRMSTFCDPSI